MDSENLETMETLLESLLEETDDQEVHYKLRTALQLLVVHRQSIDDLEAVADSDPELRDRLEELGYVD